MYTPTEYVVDTGVFLNAAFAVRFYIRQEVCVLPAEYNDYHDPIFYEAYQNMRMTVQKVPKVRTSIGLQFDGHLTAYPKGIKVTLT